MLGVVEGSTSLERYEAVYTGKMYSFRFIKSTERKGAQAGIM